MKGRKRTGKKSDVVIMPAVLALRKLGQEASCKLKASQGYKVRSRLS